MPSGTAFAVLVDALEISVETSERFQQVSWELVDSSGRQRFADSKITNLVDDPDVAGYVINTRDVTDQVLMERQLRHQAFHDDLSGLANRALFNDRAEHALIRSRRTGMEIAVLLIDLDGFKDVNDGLGHQAGDQLLRTVSDELGTTARASDTVARLGGDEFAVLMEDLRDPAEALTAAERLRTTLRASTALNHADVSVTASIGVAISDPTSTVSDLIRDADIAMYYVKNHGKDAAAAVRALDARPGQGALPAAVGADRGPRP